MSQVYKHWLGVLGSVLKPRGFLERELRATIFRCV